jgi:hypothetical protein
MAQQIAGLCYLEGTFDELTFYKMDGKYYVRVKSSLTSERVKESPEFRLTMAYANLLARASKIGSAIYKALPPGWRQFWMYRSFTGEAFTLLKDSCYTEEEVKQMLWKTYVEYWEQWEAANAGNPALPVIKAAKPKRVRKRRVYSPESLLRMKDKYGRPKWRNMEEEEKNRFDLEKKREWCARQLEQEKQREKEKLIAAQQAEKTQEQAAEVRPAAVPLTMLSAKETTALAQPVHKIILPPLQRSIVRMPHAAMRGSTIRYPSFASGIRRLCRMSTSRRRKTTALGTGERSSIRARGLG